MILPVAVVIATVVSLIAVAFFVLALFLFLAELMMSPPLAALATGGIILLVAVLIVVIGRAIASPKRAIKKRVDELGSAQSAAALGSLFGRKLHSYATSNKSAAALAALILGVAVGYSPKLRNFLLDLLRK
jgi:hypothetical protein